MFEALQHFFHAILLKQLFIMGNFKHRQRYREYIVITLINTFTDLVLSVILTTSQCTYQHQVILKQISDNMVYHLLML